MKKITQLFTLTTFLFLCVSTISYAEETIENSLEETLETLTPEQQINDISVEIQRVERSLRNQKKLSQQANNDPELKAEFENTYQQLQKQLKTLNQTLEQLATGKADLDLFVDGKSEKIKFNWQTELEEIVKPIFSELKRLTERSRKIEALNEQKKYLNEKQTAANIALENLKKFEPLTNNKLAKESLKSLITKWESRLESIQGELVLIDYQLQQKKEEEKDKKHSLLETLHELFTGRGLNFILALSAFIITFVVLKLSVNFLSRRISKKKDKKERRFYGRLINLFSQVFIFIFALLAWTATLLVMGDRVLLGLTLVLIAFVIFALRNSLPGYVDEIKTLLNLGSAREGERVIYNGIPWRLTEINFYSKLNNPYLSGGYMRLPLRVVTELISRPSAKNEGWFPSRNGDYVILGDGIYGKVNMQTPDMVELTLYDNSAYNVPTPDYLSASPRNLSNGFGFAVTFGLDYEIQSIITTEVIDTMQASIKKKLKTSKFGTWMESCNVDFEDAGASSLDLALIVLFKGEAASCYLKIERFIKKAAVDVCNEQGWSIPFSQLTVHMANQDNASE